jgi:hypothetical protein
MQMSLTSRSGSFGRLVLAALATGAAATTALAQPAPPSQLGVFGDWEAYKGTDARGTVCYVISAPKTKEPAAAKRGQIHFLISTWPGATVANEPSIMIGYPFKDGSTATVELGADSFEFFTKDDGAWLDTGPNEGRLVAAMRAQGELTVKGMSRRGTLTTDTYSLKGISAALDKLAEGCK